MFSIAHSEFSADRHYCSRRHLRAAGRLGSRLLLREKKRHQAWQFEGLDYGVRDVGSPCVANVVVQAARPSQSKR